jgi:amidase
LRIGFTEDFGVCAVDASIRRTFRQRITALGDHVLSCTPLVLPMEDPHRAFDVLRAESFLAAFADVYRTAPQTLGPNVRANVEMAASISLADRAWAHLEQTRIARTFQRAFEQVDLIVAPVTPVSPFPWTHLFAETVDGQRMRNYYEWLSLTYVVTLATNPALSLPCGVDEHGMPFGLQLIAPLHADARLLGIAHAIERAFASDAACARPLPSMQALRTPRPELRSIVTDPPLFPPHASPGGPQDATPTAV